jgi:rhodanese-related sulfurtransferase
MKLHGQEPNFVELVNPTFLDRKGGSTLTGLKRGVENNGLHSQIIVHANTRFLRSCLDPVILHVKGSLTSLDYNHYVLFLGAEGPWALICDPPDSPSWMSFDELVSRWDGNAVIVAKKPVEIAKLLRQGKMRVGMIAISVVFVLFVINRIRKRLIWPKIFSTAFGHSLMSIVQFGGLLVTSLVIGLLFHSVSEGGFLKHPYGVTSIQQAQAADFIPRINLETAKRMKSEGSIFIDARMKRDFDVEHIEEAVNIPVDTNDVLLKDATKIMSFNSCVVVYCQSNRCQYADIIAGKLRLLGYSDISILEGGWVEWDTGKSLPKPRSDKDLNSRKWRLNRDGTASSTE